MKFSHSTLISVEDTYSIDTIIAQFFQKPVPAKDMFVWVRDLGKMKSLRDESTISSRIPQ